MRTWLNILVFVLLLLAFIPAARCEVAVNMPGVNTVTVNKVPYYRLADIARFYKMSLSMGSREITMTTADGRRKVVFTAHKPDMNLFGTVVYLAYPIEKDIKGYFSISKSDFDTLLYPIFHPSRLTRRHIRTIMIDPGHGGVDHGAERGSVLEKNLNLLVANRVTAILRKRGFNVIMTRDCDKKLELQDRSNMGNYHKVDLFVSVHFNANVKSDINGIEVYVPNPAKTPSFLGAQGAVCPSNRFNQENSLLGYIMQRHLIEATHANDRGLKRVQHYVTRNVACPAVLVELGYITNIKECAKFSQQAYLDKLAASICDAITEYERVMR